MNEGSSRGRSWSNLRLALSVVGMIGLGVLGLMLSMRSAPPESKLVPPPPPSTPPSSSVTEPADAGPPEPGWTEEDDAEYPDLASQREALLRKLVTFSDFTPRAIDEVRKILAEEIWLGQGNPKCTKHPMTRAECRRVREAAKVVPADPKTCGRKHMVPIYNPRTGETNRDASVCIDQFEFPNIPCEYPVTWVRAAVAQRLCSIQGKRLCDAHEWEGACAGSVLPAEQEYAWGIRPYEDVEARRLGMEYDHNQKREIVWAYGKDKDHKKCATGSRKSDGCVTPTWERCGTNTYPAGAFPECVSRFGAYDLHGNAAEHMNLPMSPAEQARYGKLGQTEMKGSWFIFNSYEAHIDDCRWRAPDWHGGAVMAPNSHMNYHLGFRCCRDLKPIQPLPASSAPKAANPNPLASAAPPGAAPEPASSTSRVAPAPAPAQVLPDAHGDGAVSEDKPAGAPPQPVSP